MGFLRRRRQPDNGLPGRVPAPPPHEPVIDPSTGLPGFPTPLEPEAEAEPVLELPEDAPEPVSDPEEQLRRLSDLHERGLLDAEEFASQRRRLGH